MNRFAFAVFLSLALISLALAWGVRAPASPGHSPYENSVSPSGRRASVSATVVSAFHELPEITAGGAVVVRLSPAGEEALYAKGAAVPHPIASITKLMTALIAAERYPRSLPVTVSALAAEEPRDEAQTALAPGERFTAEELIRLMLIESNNGAAQALAEASGEGVFVDEMNREAASLGLRQTHFVNATGLDPLTVLPNEASATDVARLLIEVRRRVPWVFDILALPEDVVVDLEERRMEVWSTDELLDYRGWPWGVLGGKTGQTPAAGETFVVMVRAPQPGNVIVVSLLQSSDRFGDAKRLLDAFRASAGGK